MKKELVVRFAIAVFLLLSTFSRPLFSNSVWVDSAGLYPGSVTTIAAGLGKVGNGDTIYIIAGTYPEPLDLSNNLRQGVDTYTVVLKTRPETGKTDIIIGNVYTSPSRYAGVFSINRVGLNVNITCATGRERMVLVSPTFNFGNGTVNILRDSIFDAHPFSKQISRISFTSSSERSITTSTPHDLSTGAVIYIYAGMPNLQAGYYAVNSILSETMFTLKTYPGGFPVIGTGTFNLIPTIKLVALPTFNMNGSSGFTPGSKAPSVFGITPAGNGILLNYFGGINITAGLESNFGYYGDLGQIVINKTFNDAVTLRYPIAFISAAASNRGDVIQLISGSAYFMSTINLGLGDIIDSSAGTLQVNGLVSAGVSSGDETTDDGLSSVILCGSGGILLNGITWIGGDQAREKKYDPPTNPAAPYAVDNSGTGAITTGPVTLNASNAPNVPGSNNYAIDFYCKSGASLKIGPVTSNGSPNYYGTLGLMNSGTTTIAGGMYRGFVYNGGAINVNGAATVGGAFTNNANCTINLGANTLTLANSVWNAKGTYSGSGTIALVGFLQDILKINLGSSITVPNLQLNSGTNKIELVDADGSDLTVPSLTVSGLFTCTSGSLSFDSCDIILTGRGDVFTYYRGAFDAVSRTGIEYTDDQNGELVFNGGAAGQRVTLYNTCTIPNLRVEGTIGSDLKLFSTTTSVWNLAALKRFVFGKGYNVKFAASQDAQCILEFGNGCWVERRAANPTRISLGPSPNIVSYNPNSATLTSNPTIRPGYVIDLYYNMNTSTPSQFFSYYRADKEMPDATALNNKLRGLYISTSNGAPPGPTSLAVPRPTSKIIASKNVKVNSMLHLVWGNYEPGVFKLDMQPNSTVRIQNGNLVPNDDNPAFTLTGGPVTLEYVNTQWRQTTDCEYPSTPGFVRDFLVKSCTVFNPALTLHADRSCYNFTLQTCRCDLQFDLYGKTLTVRNDIKIISGVLTSSPAPGYLKYHGDLTIDSCASINNIRIIWFQ